MPRAKPLLRQRLRPRVRARPGGGRHRPADDGIHVRALRHAPAPARRAGCALGINGFVAGLVIAPTLITAMTLCQRLVPAAQLNEGMTIVVTGMLVGVGVGAGLGGQVIESAGAHRAFAHPDRRRRAGVRRRPARPAPPGGRRDPLTGLDRRVGLREGATGRTFSQTYPRVSPAIAAATWSMKASGQIRSPSTGIRRTRVPLIDTALARNASSTSASPSRCSIPSISTTRPQPNSASDTPARVAHGEHSGAPVPGCAAGGTPRRSRAHRGSEPRRTHRGRRHRGSAGSVSDAPAPTRPRAVSRVRSAAAGSASKSTTPPGDR